MSIAVVADSSASLPPALASRWGIRVVPLEVVIDGVSRPEGTGIGPEEVLERLVAGDAVTTSQPSPEAFAQAYREAVDAGAAGIVVVTLAATLSGTVDSARAAAGEVPVPVEVVDSGSVAMAVGFAAVAAADAARRGEPLATVAHAARVAADSARCVFTVSSLDHLRRGGRIGPAVAALGRVLGVRPVLEIVDGRVELIDRVRTTARARAAMLGVVAEAAAGMEHPAVAIMAVGETSLGDDAAHTLAAALPSAGDVVRTSVSAVLAVHAGPGALAAVVVELPPTAR